MGWTLISTESQKKMKELYAVPPCGGAGTPSDRLPWPKDAHHRHEVDGVNHWLSLRQLAWVHSSTLRMKAHELTHLVKVQARFLTSSCGPKDAYHRHKVDDGAFQGGHTHIHAQQGRGHVVVQL